MRMPVFFAVFIILALMAGSGAGAGPCHASPLPQDVAPSPLHVAVDAGDLKKAQNLIAKGADVNATNEIYETPLHRAVEAGRTDMVRLLLDNDADIEAREFNGETPLIKAVIHEHLDVVKLLLEGGADIDGEDVVGGTPLLYAGENLEILAYLIRKEANLWGGSDEGHTLLHAYAGNGALEAAKIVVEAGAELYAMTDDGKLAVDLAREAGEHDMVAYLEKMMAKTPPEDYEIQLMFMEAAWAGDWDKADGFLAQGADINGFDLGNATLLMNAVGTGRMDLAKVLVARGADVDAMHWAGGNALHVAAIDGRLEFVEFLIANGADVDQPDTQLWTALHHAADGGYGKIVKLLLDKGADPNLEDLDGGYPLNVALDVGDEEIIQMLRDHGAKASIWLPDEIGDLPQDLLEMAKKEIAPLEKLLYERMDFNEDNSDEAVFLPLPDPSCIEAGGQDCLKPLHIVIFQDGVWTILDRVKGCMAFDEVLSNSETSYADVYCLEPTQDDAPPFWMRWKDGKGYQPVRE
ncbi:ankyrin repeat domain-containing protein [Magnetovibrio sp. PR-2]|uniref:ankyrin repeat domain-containing protein n=1 Tax=Magnetovibrio sp. PR-2 TaxID=3120356 RepID=UPI002FCE1066